MSEGLNPLEFNLNFALVLLVDGVLGTHSKPYQCVMVIPVGFADEDPALVLSSSPHSQSYRRKLSVYEILV